MPGAGSGAEAEEESGPGDDAGGCTGEAGKLSKDPAGKRPLCFPAFAPEECAKTGHGAFVVGLARVQENHGLMQRVPSPDIKGAVPRYAGAAALLKRPNHLTIG